MKPIQNILSGTFCLGEIIFDWTQLTGFISEATAQIGVVLGAILLFYNMRLKRLESAIKREQLTQEKLRTQQFEKGNFDLSDDDTLSKTD